MPHHKSCKKRLKTSNKKRLYNRAYKTELRHKVRDFRALMDAEQATGELPGLVSMLDRLCKKGILKKETASRLKSRLYSHCNSLG
ncbi:MAG: 30S ribosomal protein S20 [Candidatus Krumholzibacteria bacterium]|nr:30S ribosomal protein S20 [Candidatus Krumholzibacteria bacterium]MDP6668785.1 30S ribosomal protein S20 [Candidatus Krumholzibacteria bacterium]MDP6797591.1 30S ribosomal protein S20 [Candidatus Krumholzibacteria bacterium]MDP7020912.1 30S ribosomal protein S20 [Candidatus Krumholzibacteria bacterium]